MEQKKLNVSQAAALIGEKVSRVWYQIYRNRVIQPVDGLYTEDDLPVLAKQLGKLKKNKPHRINEAGAA